MVLPLLGAIGIIGRHWAWFDARHLAGPNVVGLCFSGMAILGICAQLAEDLPDDGSPSDVIRRFVRYTSQMIVFLVLLVSGIAALVVGARQFLSSVLPEWLVGIVYLLAFLGYVAAVIRILMWLSDRGLIGG